MVFNSVVFLFCFLPLALLLYYAVPGRLKNAVLLIESLIFFCCSGTRFLPLILILVAVNYLFGLLIDYWDNRSKIRVLWLVIPILITLGSLIFFKYTNFLIDTINQITSGNLNELSFLDVLPLGISYYTFKLISYVADIYTGKIRAERSPITFAAYVVMYPQLLVGPIVKYRDLAPALHTYKDRYNALQIQEGAEMLVFGMAKKVIIADSIGALWTDLLSPEIGLANVSTPLAWLGIIAYSLQLYFDFAGYSEISNGLSKMMGFNCPANFDLPYISASITEFWRRWHISLSSWFRDYVYIPLGGNRLGLPRQIFNMFVVWAMTGIWHGANWNFICWGLYYFVLLTLEKTFLLKYLKKGRIWPHIYTLFFVVLGWGIFTADVEGAPLPLLMSRLFLPHGGISPLYYLRNYGVLLIVAIFCSTALPGKIWKCAKRHTPVRLVLLAAVMILSTAFIIAATNNTPLYAQF